MCFRFLIVIFSDSSQALAFLNTFSAIGKSIDEKVFLFDKKSINKRKN